MAATLAQFAADLAAQAGQAATGASRLRRRLSSGAAEQPFVSVSGGAAALGLIGLALTIAVRTATATQRRAREGHKAVAAEADGASMVV